MIALLVIDLGALQFPYISGSVPVKSKQADLFVLLIDNLSLILLPSSIDSIAYTTTISFDLSYSILSAISISISLTHYSAFY
jgi:putative effector of murein hydrolase LrgA (UPF0299 family)